MSLLRNNNSEFDAGESLRYALLEMAVKEFDRASVIRIARVPQSETAKTSIRLFNRLVISFP